MNKTPSAGKPTSKPTSLTLTKNQIWIAACTGIFPPGATAQILANSRNRNNYTALHMAAMNVYLPRDITTAILEQTKTPEGHSVWTTLCQSIPQEPARIINLPHQLFIKERQLAVDTVIPATKQERKLNTTAAAIWLGHVLADSPQN